MDKEILAAASFEKQKYLLEETFSSIPQSIQNEIKVICVTMAQRLCCTFLIGFHKTGDVYFEIVKPEGSIDFDEIGAELEILSLKKEKEELLKGLKLWYIVFKTEEGEAIRQQMFQKEDK